MPCLIEIGPAVLEKRIFKFRQHILLFRSYLPFEKGHGPQFEQIWICITNECFVLNLVKFDLVVLENSSMYFFRSLPFGKGMAFHFLITKGCFVLSLVKFDKVVLEKKIFKFIDVFLLFRNYRYLPFGKVMALHLHKLESPSHKDALCQVWMILVKWLRWRSF